MVIDVPVVFISTISNAYNLSDKDKERLRYAILNDNKPFKVDLTNFSEKKKQLLMGILQDEISEMIIDQMYDLTFSNK